MKIELKRISHNERLSQETEAFAADLWINGVKRGEVSNEGHGGCHHFTDHAAERELDEYGKTLPPEPRYGLTMTGELLVADVLAKWLDDKAKKKAQAKLAKWCKTMTVIRTPDMPEGTYTTFKAPFNKAMKDYVLAKYPAAIFINETIQ